MLVAYAKIHLEEKGTKQSRQADKAVGPVCLACCLLLVLAFKVDFYKLINVEQSTFL
jgi:hypothetical protein